MLILEKLHASKSLCDIPNRAHSLGSSYSLPLHKPLSAQSSTVSDCRKLDIPESRSCHSEIGRLDPSLYQNYPVSKKTHGRYEINVHFQNDSTSAESWCGKLSISHSWCGIFSEQVNVRIVKMKNIPEKYDRAGLYIRSVLSMKTSIIANATSSGYKIYPTLLVFFSQQLSLGWIRGFIMKNLYSRQNIHHKIKKISNTMLKVPTGQSSITVWGVIYMSDVRPRVVANFSHEIYTGKNKSEFIENKVNTVCTFYIRHKAYIQP